MRVIQLNSHDLKGGAARAVNRLHKGLLKASIDSTMLVHSKMGKDISVVGPSTKAKKAISIFQAELEPTLLNFVSGGSGAGFSPAWLPFSNIPKQVQNLNPDIVHLHWVCGGMLRLEQLKNITKPIVWTLHDMWAFTGGCHYSDECSRYMNGCGNCPQLTRSSQYDLSYKIHSRKEKAWQGLDITIVSPSHWLAERARESFLFKGKRIDVIPNGLDINTFKPVNKQYSRNVWSFSQDKKIILFGALSADSDERKGFELLKESIQYLPNKDLLELVVFGADAPKNQPDYGLPIRYLGTLHDDVSLALLYSSADVTLVPSRTEAFGQTASESLACGTPVVSFAVAGLLDIVDHQVNGYLAKPFCTNDFAKGIEWVLSNNFRHAELSVSARTKAEQLFSTEIVAQQYIDLYKSIL
jgi:glycosyltransferase involved in cell wall biosynthesis